MIIAIVLIILIFVGTAAFVVLRLYSQVANRNKAFEKSFVFLKEEIEHKEKYLSSLVDCILGYVTRGSFETATKQIGELEESMRAEQGRMTITQAELEAIETRLRELEEIERELEASAIEAGREIEMLRSQERDLQSRNAALRAQIDSSIIQLDVLISEVESTTVAAEQFSKLKRDLIATQEKATWYTDEVAKLNEKYMELKNSYDALDIEYAQLYEKHNALEAAAAKAAS